MKIWNIRSLPQKSVSLSPKKHRMQRRVMRNNVECSIGQCGNTVKISRPSSTQCGVSSVRKVELPLTGVAISTPRAVIMFLAAQNENTSAFHRQHSPDLVPSDYHLFGIPKRQLGRRFTTNAEVEKWTCPFFADLDWSIYDAGVCKLVPLYEKCLEQRGNYVEK